MFPFSCVWLKDYFDCSCKTPFDPHLRSKRFKNPLVFHKTFGQEFIEKSVWTCRKRRKYDFTFYIRKDATTISHETSALSGLSARCHSLIDPIHRGYCVPTISSFLSQLFKFKRNDFVRAHSLFRSFCQLHHFLRMANDNISIG